MARGLPVQWRAQSTLRPGLHTVLLPSGSGTCIILCVHHRTQHARLLRWPEAFCCTALALAAKQICAREDERHRAMRSTSHTVCKRPQAVRGDVHPCRCWMNFSPLHLAAPSKAREMAPICAPSSCTRRTTARVPQPLRLIMAAQACTRAGLNTLDSTQHVVRMRTRCRWPSRQYTDCCAGAECSQPRLACCI